VERGGVERGGVERGGVERGGVERGGVESGGVERGGVERAFGLGSPDLNKPLYRDFHKNFPDRPYEGHS
jgi:hypothetical protein